MLKAAINYKEEVTKRFHEIWFNDRYKYFACQCYFDEQEIADDSYNAHQFVSVRQTRWTKLDVEEEVIGYIEYNVDRAAQRAYGLCVVNFEEKPSMTFSVDFGRALQDIFEKFNLAKLNFSVIVGNPIEASYDKICNKYGGRVVGTYKNHRRLFDGRLYDQKLYEIMAEDYFSHKGECV